MRVTVNQTMIGDTIGADTIVIDTENGAYYTLTSEAAELWASAQDGAVSVPETAATIAYHLVNEGILLSDSAPGYQPLEDSSTAFSKIASMADILLADPVHEVDEDGWPKLR